MINRARSGVGSLGSGERHGLPSQAPGARLPDVSMIGSTRSVDRGHAGARLSVCRIYCRNYPDCPVVIPGEKASGLCYGCERDDG